MPISNFYAIRYGDIVEQTIRATRYAAMIQSPPPYFERDAICPNHRRESSGKMCTYVVCSTISP